MKTKLIAALALTSLPFLAFAQSWSYSAPTGPAQWGSLPGAQTCQTGADQSPIAIETGVMAGLTNVVFDSYLPALDLQWASSSFNVLNNGHTVEMIYDAGSTATVEGASYALKQFHFHSPSEHMLDGRLYPLEAHFVHASASGAISVIGVFFKEGAANPALEPIWKNAPIAPVEVATNIAGLSVDARDLLPADMNYFTYGGSLTTPPCSEGVRWFVMAKPIEASAAQLRFLRARLGFSNNRPIQELDGRTIEGSVL